MNRFQGALKASLEGYGGVTILLVALALADASVTLMILDAATNPIISDLGFIIGYTLDRQAYKTMVMAKSIGSYGICMIVAVWFYRSADR